MTTGAFLAAAHCVVKVGTCHTRVVPCYMTRAFYNCTTEWVTLGATSCFKEASGSTRAWLRKISRGGSLTWNWTGASWTVEAVASEFLESILRAILSFLVTRVQKSTLLRTFCELNDRGSNGKRYHWMLICNRQGASHPLNSWWFPKHCTLLILVHNAHL